MGPFGPISNPGETQMTTKRTAKPEESSSPAFGPYLKQLTKLAGAAQEVILCTHKKGTQMTIVGLGSVASCVVPIRIEGEDFKCSLQITALDCAFGSTGGRDAELSFKEDSLYVNTKRSNFQIITKEAANLPTVETPKEGHVEVALDAEFWTILNNSLPYLRLEKVSASQPDCRLYVEATEKTIFIVSYDMFQLAFVSKKNTSGVVGSFNVPYASLQSVIKDLPNAAKTRLFFGEDSLILKSEVFSASYSITPLAQNDPPGPDVKAKAREIAKTESSMVSFSAKDLEEVLGSLRSIAQDDTKIVFTAKGSKAKLEASSSFGSASVSLPLSVKTDSEVKFALELKFLRNLVGKWKEDLNIGLVDSALVLRTPAVTYVTVTSDL